MKKISVDRGYKWGFRPELFGEFISEEEGEKIFYGAVARFNEYAPAGIYWDPGTSEVLGYAEAEYDLDALAQLRDVCIESAMLSY